MYRKLLIIWLLISLLGYGMLVVADMHEQHMDDHAHSMDFDSHPASADDNNNCDHCCHGLIHLLGLTYSDSFSIKVEPQVSLSDYNSLFVSFSPPLHLRPPISA